MSSFVNASGDITRWVVPSRQGALSLSTTYPRSAPGGYGMIPRKGATNHAIGLVTASLLQCLVRGDAACSRSRACRTATKRRRWACWVWRSRCPRWWPNKAARTQVLVPQMDEAEREALQHSAQVLWQAAASTASA